ncbi:MAG: lipopolysaccharide biosynthesis protein [Parvibaculum sp.]
MTITSEPDEAIAHKSAPTSLPNRLRGVVARLRSTDANSRDTAFAALKVLIIRCLGAAIAYITQVLLSRALGQTEYGVFALVWVWIIVLGHLTPVGIAQAALKYIPHYHALKEPGLTRGYIFYGLALVTLFSCVTALIGGVVLTFGASLFDNIYALPLLVALFAVPLFALQDYVENIARSFNWMILAIAPPFVIRHGLIGLGVLAAYLTDREITAATAVAITVGAVTLSLALQAGFVFWRIRKIVPAAPHRAELRVWLKTALPLIFVDGTLLLFSNADILILSLFVSPAEIALYFAASRILQLVAFVQYATTAATTQQFSALNAMGDHAALEKLARNTTRLTFMAAVGAAAIIYLMAPFLLTLFGDGFVGAMPVLGVLMIGLIVQAFSGPAESVLNMSGHERTTALTYSCALLLNIALNLVLIPIYGAVGAAIATALSLALASLALTFALKKHLGISVFFSFIPDRTPDLS